MPSCGPGESATESGSTRATGGTARGTDYRGKAEFDPADDMLRLLLTAIADDVSRQAGAAADAVRSLFAIRIENACRDAPAHQRAVIMRSLMTERDSALAAIAENAAVETRGRQQTAIATKGGQHQQGRGQDAATEATQTRNTGGRTTGREPRTDSRVTPQMLHQAGRAATGRAEQPPAPRTRKRGSGETASAFRPAARILRRHPAAPPGIDHAAIPFLADTLDWLNLWDDAAGEDNEPGAEFDTYQNHLSPQLRL